MHPIIFEIPVLGWPIHSFGAMLAIAFLLGMWRVDRYAAHVGMDRKHMSDLTIWVIVSVIVGCRILYFMVHPDQFSVWDFFMLQKGGLVFYGGFILSLIVGNWRARKYGFKLLQATDIIMVTSFLGLFVGRWGCLLVGDDFGKETDPANWPSWLQFLITKTPDPLPDKSQFPGPGLYLHPTQIYMSINALLLFIIGHNILIRQRAWGVASCWLLLLYAITRSIIEVFRGDDQARGSVGALSTSQLISIPIFLAGVLGLVLIAKKRGKDRVFALPGLPKSADLGKTATEPGP